MESSDTVRSRSHWDRVYEKTPVQLLGWYEPEPAPSLRLIERCGIDRSDLILDVGSGATTLIKALLDRGYRRIVAADISRQALELGRARLSAERADLVQWITDDVTQPRELSNLTDVALWHDRALLHFLLSDDKRRAYKETLDLVLRPGGWVAIAEFSTSGARRCSGLDVRRYDHEMLSSFLGSSFEAVEHFDYVYETPSGGERPYICALFRHRGDSVGASATADRK